MELKCEICKNSFTSQSHYNWHIKSHFPEPKIQCGYCGRQFKTDQLLARHLGGVHKNVKYKSKKMETTSCLFKKASRINDSSRTRWSIVLFCFPENTNSIYLYGRKLNRREINNCWYLNALIFLENIPLKI